MLTPGRSIIGIDVGERFIAAAQLSTPRRGSPEQRHRLEAAACVPRARAASKAGLSAEEARTLMDVLPRQGFTGREAAVAVPTGRLLTAVLDLPPRSSGAPLDSIARSEIARVHRVEPASIESAWWELPAPHRAGEAQAAFAVACTHTTAESALAPLEDAAGVRVATLEGRATALARAWLQRLPRAGRVCALVDLAWENALLAVACEGVVVYERVLDEAGLSRLHARLASELAVEPEIVDHVLFSRGLAAPSQGSDPALSDFLLQSRECILEHLQQVASEITLSTSYAARRYAHGASGGDLLLISGEGAAIPGATAALSKLAGAEAEGFDGAKLLDVHARAAAAAAHPAIAVAVGLALWQPPPASSAQPIDGRAAA